MRRQEVVVNTGSEPAGHVQTQQSMFGESLRQLLFFSIQVVCAVTSSILMSLFGILRVFIAACTWQWQEVTLLPLCLREFAYTRDQFTRLCIARPEYGSGSLSTKAVRFLHLTCRFHVEQIIKLFSHNY